MAPPTTALVQGQEVSYVELAVTAHIGDGKAPLDLSDLKSINWDSTNTPGMSGGPGRFATRRTTGRTVYTAACTIYAAGAEVLIPQLGEVAEELGLIDPDDGSLLWGQVQCSFGIKFAYLETDPTRQIELVRVRFISDAETSAEGEAAQEAAFNLHPMKIRRKIGPKWYAL